MAISFPRSIPDVGYVTCDLILRDTVAASPSGGGLINYTQVAAPAWEVTLETRPLDYDEYSAVEAWWLSLRGGLRSVLFRQPHNGNPMAHRMDQAPARTPGRLASVSGGNALSIISVDPALILSAGDRIGLEHANRWYVGRVTVASGSGTTRVVSVEPPPPSNIAQAGAVVRFDRPGLLMRPVPDSYQATRGGRHYSVSFRLVEVAGVGSVPRDMDFNFNSPLVAAPYFTRASSATYYGADGLLKTAAINEPRIDHDPVTREPLGILIEEQRTNLLTWSEKLNRVDGGWNENGAPVITLNAGLAPNGLMTATLLEASGYASGVFKGADGVQGATYTMSGFVKSVTPSGTLMVEISGGAYGNVGAVVTFNASTGAIVSNPGGLTAAVFDCGNGWWRFGLSRTATANGSVFVALYGTAAGEAFQLWGAQLETGAFPTSYIPTSGAQATRASENCIVPSTEWINSAEGTLFVEFRSRISDGQNQYVVGLGTDTTASILDVQVGNNRAQGVVFKDAVPQAIMALIPSPDPALAFVRAALAYKQNDFAYTVSGGNPAIDDLGEVPTLWPLRIGRGFTPMASVHIKRVTYFPRRLSNAELQEITT